MPRYDKAIIEQEAIRSAQQGRITEELGKFILQRSIEVAGSAFVTDGNEELQAGTNRCCCDEDL